MENKKPKLTAKEKRINAFKKDFDALSDILYTKGYLPDGAYSTKKLYHVFKVVHDWLDWYKQEDIIKYRFDGLKKAIVRDVNDGRIEENPSRKIFCALLHLGDVTDKIIEGTYRLSMDSSTAEEVELLDYRYIYTSIIVKDNKGKQVGNHRWVAYSRPRQDTDFTPLDSLMN